MRPAEHLTAFRGWRKQCLRLVGENPLYSVPALQGYASESMVIRPRLFMMHVSPRQMHSMPIAVWGRRHTGKTKAFNAAIHTLESTAKVGQMDLPRGY